MASRLFRLTVDDLTAHGRFSLRLTDGRDQFLFAFEVKADPQDASWRGLFELDAYLERERGRYSQADQDTGQADRALLDELGDFLRTDVLGPEITAELFRSRRPGTLFVELPAERRPEVIELTRIPWELARDEQGRLLSDVGLAVQVLPWGAMPEGASLDQALGQASPFELAGPLRVLLAFAQSRGQTMLAMRAMRERLRHFFLAKLAPRYRVAVDILQYGVTRETLRQAARRGDGYDIVHLFAHGHEDLLILEDEAGGDDPVRGEELAELLSGDFAAPPYLVFLTACHSGEVKVERELPALWQALRQAQGLLADGVVDEQAAALVQTLEESLEADYTGTAFAMLRAEVPQVVAMRYNVEETFAFDLAEAFYRHLFLDRMPPAQALARFRVKARKEGERQGYRPHDWATPAFFGRAEGSQPIHLARGRSEIADRLGLRGKLPDELRVLKHFVGRADELRHLRRHLFSATEADQALALLWGVGGLGKTALAAEAVHLWQADFDFALGIRPAAADQALSLDGWLQDIDYYAQHSLGVAGYRIWAEQPEDLPRERWLDTRLDELLRFLNTHPILLVIDNFEPNLRRQGEAGQVQYLCADPHWSATLARLARDLSPGMSRLLLTSRRAPAELSDQARVLNLPVGPLDAGEWWAFARTALNFRRLILGSNEDRQLLVRALAVARGHPLILTTLEKLAADPDDLARRLDEFEARGRRYAGLGDLLATAPTSEEGAAEMAYFEEIAAHSIRALIEDRSPAAQRLLRVICLALEPIDDDLVAYVWEDEHFSEDAPRLQPPSQGWQAPLQELLAAGLLTPELKTATRSDGTRVENTTYVWHPIVAEQAVELLPAGDDFPEAAYQGRYAARNLATFSRFRQPQSQPEAQIALAAARAAMPYLLRLGDSGRAVALINAIHNLSQTLGFRRDLQGWIGQLLDQVPPGEDREDLLRTLADVYRAEGRPQAAIPLYRRALASAEARADWSSCGVTSHQSGNAFRDTADYPAARAAYRAALRYKRRAGKLISARLTSLVELVRLLIIEGGERKLARASTHAAWLVAIAQAYYDRCQADPASVEAGATAAPEDMLGPALDVQRQVEHTTGNWDAAIRICEAKIELKQRHHKGDLAVALDRGNRATNLLRLDRLDEAEQDLLFCLRVFRQHQQPFYESKVLSLLGELADERGDPARAIQFETQALAVCHRLGALSDAAISHESLNRYYDKLDQFEKAVLEGCCGALIRVLIGEHQTLNTSLMFLSRTLSKMQTPDRRTHWPTAAALFAAHPLLKEMLAPRGVDEAQAQAVLDQLWELVEKMMAQSDNAA